MNTPGFCRVPSVNINDLEQWLVTLIKSSGVTKKRYDEYQKKDLDFEYGIVFAPGTGGAFTSLLMFDKTNPHQATVNNEYKSTTGIWELSSSQLSAELIAWFHKSFVYENDWFQSLIQHVKDQQNNIRYIDHTELQKHDQPIRMLEELMMSLKSIEYKKNIERRSGGMSKVIFASHHLPLFQTMLTPFRCTKALLKLGTSPEYQFYVRQLNWVKHYLEPINASKPRTFMRFLGVAAQIPDLEQYTEFTLSRLNSFTSMFYNELIKHEWYDQKYSPFQPASFGFWGYALKSRFKELNLQDFATYLFRNTMISANSQATHYEYQIQKVQRQRLTDYFTKRHNMVLINYEDFMFNLRLPDALYHPKHDGWFDDVDFSRVVKYSTTNLRMVLQFYYFLREYQEYSVDIPIKRLENKLRLLTERADKLHL